MDSRVADPSSRGSKTVEDPLTDDSEYEVCDMGYEIITVSRVRLQWGIGLVVHLPGPQSAASGTEEVSIPGHIVATAEESV